MRPRNRSSLLFSLVLFFTFAFPTSADWLVGADGTRIETRGGWKVKGSTVIFELPNGTLSSMRLSAIDVEASARASVEPRPEVDQRRLEELRTSGPRPKPVLVLTNDNVAAAAETGEPGQEVSEPGSEAATEGEDDADASEPGLIEVISWYEGDGTDTGGVEISGTLRNHSSSIVTDVDLEVSLLDSAGRVVARSRAFLDAESMAARANTSFRALFPGVNLIEGTPRFTIRSRELRLETTEEVAENGF